MCSFILFFKHFLQKFRITIYFIIERMHNLDLTFDEILEELFDPEDTKENETRVINFTDNLLKVSVSDEN